MRRVLLLCSLLALVACAQPPPPPPAAAAPPPPPPPPAEHNFTVFFDWDRANVTPDGRQIVEAAAAYYKQAPGPVQVTGHTDTSGSAAFNQKLSVRRAQNVATVMAQSGVPQGEMNVSGRGENDLKVPTPDGVREAQNRRTEIIVGAAAPPPPPPGPPPPAPSQ